MQHAMVQPTFYQQREYRYMKMSILNMRIPDNMKNKAKKAAVREDLSLTQWVKRAIADRLLKENP